MTLTHPLGMQLYSGRKFPPVEAQLATIARHGFTNVETFAPFYDDVAATKRMLDAHGLSARSGHFSVAMLESDGERAVDDRATARRRDRRRALSDACRTSSDGRGLEGASERGWLAIEARLSAAGLRFAWHNHDFEFQPLDGRVAADRASPGRPPPVGSGSRLGGARRGRSATMDRALSRPHSARPCQGHRAGGREGGRRRLGRCRRREPCHGPNSGRSASRRAPR